MVIVTLKATQTVSITGKVYVCYGKKYIYRFRLFITLKDLFHMGHLPLFIFFITQRDICHLGHLPLFLYSMTYSMRILPKEMVAILYICHYLDFPLIKETFDV